MYTGHLNPKRTIQFPNEFGPLLLRQVNSHIINWHPRERYANSDERIDGVSEQRDDDQEQAAQTVDDGEDQGQLRREQHTHL